MGILTAGQAVNESLSAIIVNLCFLAAALHLRWATGRGVLLPGGNHFQGGGTGQDTEGSSGKKRNKLHLQVERDASGGKKGRLNLGTI